jgi:hypothetical protein
LNFAAAIDVGYDVTEPGKTAIARWGYSAIALFVGSVVSCVAAIRARP